MPVSESCSFADVSGIWLIARRQREHMALDAALSAKRQAARIVELIGHEIDALAIEAYLVRRKWPPRETRIDFTRHDFANVGGYTSRGKL